MASVTPEICSWRGGKTWVYSITFDEALSELHRFAVPILEEHAVPGHVEVVVGHIGAVRRIGQSSYNGFHHMSAEELREMVGCGWGVGNHSYTHFTVNADTADLELGHAKTVLEDACGQHVTIYCAPGSNENMNPEALAACGRYGYLGAMGITDALNLPESPTPLWLNRTFLHTQGYGPFFSEFDPYRNIQNARHRNGWIIDYCHCPLEKAVHINKDCSESELRDRIELVVGEGGDDVWLALPEEVVDYRLVAQHTKITQNADKSFSIQAENLPDEVIRRTVTLSLPNNETTVTVDGKVVDVVSKGGRAVVDVDVSSQRQLRIGG